MSSSIESEPDVPLVGVAGWFVFLWAISHVCPEALMAPWSFNGCVGPVFSAAAWLVGGLPTVGFVMIFLTEERKPLFLMPLELLRVMASWGLVFLALVASVHFISAQDIPAFVVAEDPLKSQIEKLRERQMRLSILISDLGAERSSIVRRIRKGYAQAVHAHELLAIDRSLKQLKGEAEEAALTITKGEALLRKNEREKRLQEAGVDSNELAELRVEIEERLSEPRSAGEAIQLERVIEQAKRLTSK